MCVWSTHTQLREEQREEEMDRERGFLWALPRLQSSRPRKSQEPTTKNFEEGINTYDYMHTHTHFIDEYVSVRVGVGCLCVGLDLHQLEAKALSNLDDVVHATFLRSTFV